MSTAISFVIPVLNEADSISSLHREIVSMCAANNYTYEIIFVNDGSTDNSAEIIDSLHPVRAIHFRRKYGQTAGLDAGIKASQYPLIVTLDGDGQNDPADVPQLIEHLINYKLDVVSGWRVNRQDPFTKNLVSRVANVMRSVLLDDGINDSGCTLKVYRKSCFDNIHLYGEMHRFIPGLLKIHGYKIGEIPVNHRPRTAGKTKYNWTRTVKGMLDMLSLWFLGKYAVRPLHLLGGIGFVAMVGSLFSLVVSLYQFVNGQDMSETLWPVLTLFLMLFGIIFLVLGLTLDIIIKSYYENLGLRPYHIKSITENP